MSPQPAGVLFVVLFAVLGLLLTAVIVAVGGSLFYAVDAYRDDGEGEAAAERTGIDHSGE